MMKHVAETSLDAFQRALDSVEEKTPTLRLAAAIAYKHGVTQSELARWFDVERKTIYNWLTRFEDPDLARAARDDDRPGRPPKLTADQVQELHAILRQQPAEVGLDAPGWTTGLLRSFVRERFGVEYSRPSCRRLMVDAGLRPEPVDASLEATDGAGSTGAADDRERPAYVWSPE